MAKISIALLSLLTTALARPQVGHGNGHVDMHHLRRHHMSGSDGPGPFHHHKPTGTAPFPAGNGTMGAATGSTGATAPASSGGPIYITSTIEVVPTPLTTDIYDSASGSGAGSGAGETNSPGNSGAAPSGGSPGSPGGSGGASECGPATVTITSANTVTVTVTPAAESGANSNGPAQPSVPSSSVNSGAPISSAPFPLGNSSAPAGTGTGTGAPTLSPAAITTTSSSVAASSPSPSVPAAQPYIAAPEKYKPQPNRHHEQPATPPPSSSAYVAAAAQSPAAYSAAPSSSSTASASSGSTGGKKGITYNTQAQVGMVSDATWSCNWASTPLGTNPVGEFVPQLWGRKPGMQGGILDASKGAYAVLYYNEPDKLYSQGGSQVPVGDAITEWTQYMLPVQQKGRKVSTPCVANDATDYMSTFLEAFPAGTMDIMCFHWYGSNSVDEVKGVVNTFAGLAKAHGIKELWINEMAVTTGPCGDLTEITKYLDGAVDRYAYNMNNMAGCTGY